MKKIFLKPDNPLLTKIAKKISSPNIFSEDTKNDVRLMLKIALGEQKEKSKPIMVGLAAPQIGISKRIILVDIAANGKGKAGNLKVYINPEIIWKSKAEKEWYEGCYSTERICGIVSRSISIKIQGFAITPSRCKAKFVKEKFTDYTARIFQHEIDHLNGILFISHIKDPDKLHLVKKSEFPLYRDKQAWRNWPRKYPFSNLIGKD